MCYFDLLPCELIIIIMKYLRGESLIFSKLEGYEKVCGSFIAIKDRDLAP